MNHKIESRLMAAVQEFIRKAPEFPEEIELAKKLGRLMGDPEAIREHLAAVEAVEHSMFGMWLRAE